MCSSAVVCLNSQNLIGMEDGKWKMENLIHIYAFNLEICIFDFPGLPFAHPRAPIRKLNCFLPPPQIPVYASESNKETESTKNIKKYKIDFLIV